MDSIKKNQENWNATVSGNQEAAVLNLQTYPMTKNTSDALRLTHLRLESFSSSSLFWTSVGETPCDFEITSEAARVGFETEGWISVGFSETWEITNLSKMATDGQDHLQGFHDGPSFKSRCITVAPWTGISTIHHRPRLSEDTDDKKDPSWNEIQDWHQDITISARSPINSINFPEMWWLSITAYFKAEFQHQRWAKGQDR